jgi:hypothetical protein
MVKLAAMSLHLDPSSGGFGEKVQQVLFVPEDELEIANKTRVALVRVYFKFSFSLSLFSLRTT